MNTKNIEGIIFDLDGTLVDSREDIAMAANYVRQEAGYGPLPVEEVISFTGDGLVKMLERVLGSEDCIEDAAVTYRNFHSEHLLDNTRPYPGVVKVLDSLKGKKLGVLTNKPYEFSERILEGLGIKKYFGKILGGGSTPYMKPDAQFLNIIMEELGVDSEQTLMVGDRYTDIQVGLECGVRTVFAEYGFGERRDFAADFRINKIEELLEIV